MAEIIDCFEILFACYGDKQNEIILEKITVLKNKQ